MLINDLSRKARCYMLVATILSLLLETYTLIDTDFMFNLMTQLTMNNIVHYNVYIVLVIYILSVVYWGLTGVFIVIKEYRVFGLCILLLSVVQSVLVKTNLYDVPLMFINSCICMAILIVIGLNLTKRKRKKKSKFDVKI